MTLTNELLRRLVRTEGYPEPAPGELFILGFQGAEPYPGGGLRLVPNEFDRYNDVLVLAGPVLQVFRGTVDPGRTFTRKPLHPQGCAHLELGAYQYHRGIHRGHAALVQAGPVRVRRDRDRDGLAEADEPVDTGYFGVNIHAMGATPQIGSWSAGCQGVAGGWDGEPWRTFMRTVCQYHQPGYWYYRVDTARLVRLVDGG